MASPFAIFRRNQKLGMAILTLMAMFAFVFLDSIGRFGQSNGAGGSEVIVKTSVGDFDRAKLSQLMATRRNANMFLAAAFQRAAFAAAEAKRPMQTQQPFQFNYGRGNEDRDVILGYLFKQEAEKMGIVVSNETIDGFISQITEGNFSSTSFREVVRDMQLTGKDVYDSLRSELMGRYYFIYGRPQPTTTPAELWSYYRMLNVRSAIEVAAIPVGDFTSQISDPSDGELKTFFEAHKDRFAYDVPNTEEAGFKQPQRAQLQYLTLSFEEAEKLVPDVSDAEVTEYYEKNKATLYRNRPFPETPPKDGAGAEAKPEDASKNEGTPPPAAEGEAKPETEGAKPESGEAKPEESKPAESVPEKPEEGKAEETKSDDEAPKIIPDKPAEDKKDENKQSLFKLRETSVILASAGEIPPSVFLNLEDQTTGDGEKKADEEPKIEPAKPADQPAPEEKKEAEITPESDSTKENPPAEEKPAGEKTEGEAKPDEKKGEPEPEFRPLDEVLKTEIREYLHREKTLAKMEQVAADAAEKLTDVGVLFNVAMLVSGNELYLDLNDDGQKSEGEPFVKIEGKINPERIDPRQKLKLNKVAAADSAKKLQELATALGMKYGETGLISQQELAEIEGLGRSVIMRNGPQNPFDTTQVSALSAVYGEETIYRPLRLEDPDSGDIFVGWKVVYLPMHVPEFEDDGIKEQVLAAWKLEKARELAEKRGEELAEVARQSKKSLAEALADQKLIESAAEPIKVNETPSFSWLRTTSVPSPNAFMEEVRPEMSEVPFVKSPGEKFMRTVFDNLKPGEIGVTVDYNASTFYIMRVKDREPSEEALAEKRADFMNGHLFGFNFGGRRIGATPYDFLSDVESQQAVVEWVQRLEKSYRVEFVDEDQLESTGG